MIGWGQRREKREKRSEGELWLKRLRNIMFEDRIGTLFRNIQKPSKMMKEQGRINLSC